MMQPYPGQAEGRPTVLDYMLHDELQARPAPQEHVQCFECKRSFRGEGNKARHKCTAEHQKPICEQRGAVQCTICLG